MVADAVDVGVPTIKLTTTTLTITTTTSTTTRDKKTTTTTRTAPIKTQLTIDLIGPTIHV